MSHKIAAQQLQQAPLQAEELSAELESNVALIKQIFGNSSDLVFRRLTAPIGAGLAVAAVYVEGIVNADKINDHILKPLMQPSENEVASPDGGPFALLWNRILTVGGIQEVTQTPQLFSALLSGQTIVLIEGCSRAIAAETSGGDRRSVEEPRSQNVIRGSKEGFTEDIVVNASLLRRRIKSPNLWMETRTIGKVTQTQVSVMYLKGVANDKVVAEIGNRLNKIDTDSILESGYIEEFIQDATFTPFPTIMNTERPDAAAAGILEGQIAILVDGTPFVLLAPVTFFKFFHSSEDYYHRYDIMTFIRIMRYIAFIMSMLMPSLYVAITTFHQEMLPTTLLISLMAQREGVPFPALVEALMMELTFEVLREAGIRMPRAIGSAISVVGALVLGQAAVQAGLVSAGMVIVVSFTAISNFVAPAINIAIAARLLRFVLIFLAGTLGLFGIMAGLLAILIHMAGLRSFGVPYLTPIAPFIAANQKDVFIRVPWWLMIMRPKLLVQQNQKRQGTTAQAAFASRKKKKSDQKQEP
ncbi:spore gernimation protein KA [Gordoniibacillus kamchatkensis]|uniref:Spore gernimation protein KA n=1 Tax=Gordoniibacillus kamchatkensis TaxID=1590651 RepID=A0ABR5AJ03_9BACL|nr:spore gernimation protein KA [Paenibacillus sp. VKM B-2647]